ncbi:hypothetical protein L6452_27031 [Arctium lappa]|uniref:Uncharacterized protein n=1 Tax=Arctium lappa TaxID=4217 RepID=A0ACB8ZVN5_ARCLA|nr:hypothetical protein L6452_27031 [Arctium lappa]
MKGDSSAKDLEKSYFDVLGLCCSSEVPLIEKILKPLEGVHHVSVVVPSRTVIVLHDAALISQFQIVKALNQARLEANVRMKGDQSYRNKWPSPYAGLCGLLLLLSFLKYVYPPFKWLALGAVAVGIIPLFLKAIASLRSLRFDINVLILIAVGGSIFLKDYWEAGTIVFLLTISEWLERRASHKATAVMSSLMNMAPQKAVLADTGEEVNANEVMVNTRLAVKAGTMIPIDGIVVEGNCEVDEKALTGESFPVSKQVDSIVWAGTVNLNGYISVKTTALAEACVVARMAKLVEEAQNNKSKTQRYVDKCAKYYTPAVCVVAACLAAIPAAKRVHNLDKWYHMALVVLVSACPCALILSTPVAAFCALSKAATSGLLVKGAEYLEMLSTVKVICFDKTGTITKGEFSVSNFNSLIIDTNKLLYWVSSIESKSSHPMAAALVDYAQSRSVEPQPDNVEEFKDFPGEGIYGKIDGKDVYIGNQKIAIRAGCSQVPRNGSENNEGKSIGYIFLGSSPAGTFSLFDSCRIGVKEALHELKSMGIKTAMLTGDCQAAANHAQNQLGGALEVVHAELLPQDKARIIKDIQREFSTAMVGDGLNDAPALATADIGISMGVSGSALANETGHVILMSNDIRRIPIAVKLARKTRRKIFENIFIAFVTKAAIIALAIVGHPLVWAAVLADVGTCLLVIFNSMLLLHGTNLKTMKKHSGVLHDHAKCSLGSKVQDKCSDLGKKNCGCCGHDDDVQEMKHLVQPTQANDSCCNSVRETEDNDGCCAHDDHCIQETIVDNCCAHDVDEVHEVMYSQHEKEKHGCCAHENDSNEIHEVKTIKISKDMESASCENLVKKLGECSHNEVNHENPSGLKSSHDHQHHHHHHDHQHHHHDHEHQHHHDHDHHHVKEYITGDELGKIVKNCCRSHGLKKRNVGGCCRSFSFKCCGNQGFGVGFNGKRGYLAEIVIE